MPVSLQKSVVQRQENRYQNRRTKDYLAKQIFLKDLPTHPEILASPIVSMHAQTTWQKLLFLSSLFATIPLSARATTTTTQTPSGNSQNSANRTTLFKLDAMANPAVPPATNSAVQPRHHSVANALAISGEKLSKRTAPAFIAPSLVLSSARSIALLSAKTTPPSHIGSATTPHHCQTILDCFTDFLQDAGSTIRTQFTQLLDSTIANLASPDPQQNESDSALIRARLRRAFPNLENEEIDLAHSVKKSHRRRHLDLNQPPSVHDSIANASLISTEAMPSENVTTTDKEVYERIKARLNTWVNATEAEQRIKTPTDALGAVLHHYDASLPDDFLSLLDQRFLDEQDMRSIDEAALLYQQIHPEQFPLFSLSTLSPFSQPHLVDQQAQYEKPFAIDNYDLNLPTQNATAVANAIENTTSLNYDYSLRNEFLNVLLPDLKKEILLQNMFTPIINGSDAEIFFDGIALRGAFGKNAEDLLGTVDLKRVDGFAELPCDIQRERLKEKFERLGEDAAYQIGTTAQSLGSTVKRILKYQHKNVPEKFESEKNLFETFHKIELDWEIHRNYPLHPRLLFAEHLAHASNVKMHASNWQEQVWQEECLPLLKALEDRNNPYFSVISQRSLVWLGSYLAHWNHDGQSWGMRGEAIKREALSSLFNHFQDISHTYYPGLSTAEIKKYIDAQQFIGPATISQYKTALEHLVEQLKIQSTAPHSSEHSSWLEHKRNMILHSVNIVDNYLKSQEAEKAKQEQEKLIAEIETGQTSLPTGQPPDLIIWLAKYLSETMLASEIIASDDWQSRTSALLQYAGKRLLANYGTAPIFDRSVHAYVILKRYGLDEAQINKARSYTIGSASAHISKTGWGSLVQQFLDRADWNGLIGKTMYIRLSDGKRQRINPQAELEAAENEWNKNLPMHPWVQARAYENMLSKTRANTLLSNAAIHVEAHRISNSYLAETEEHRHLMVGFETWINTIPLIGPIYNIEEGVRHKETSQIILGSFFLAIDAFDFAAGGRPRAAAMAATESLDSAALRVPLIEHITASSTHSIAEELDIPISDFYTSSATSSEASLVLVNSDPWKIALPDANIPLKYRSLATQVRNGESNVRWTAPNDQEFDVIRIANEDRIVAVQHASGNFHEVSWDDGHLVNNAKLIYYDAGTQTYFSAQGLKGGGRPSGDLRLDEERLSKRYTPREVHLLLLKAKDIKPIHSVATHFSQQFPIVFGSTASTFPAHAFYTEVYAKSPTFRRLTNFFFKKNGGSSLHSAKWQIEIVERNRPAVTLLNIQRLPHKSIYIPDDAHIANLQYLGVDGWHKFTAEQVYLDGLITAMSGKPDVVMPMHTITRGPNIALRDRILFEAGYNLPQQTTYSRVTSAERTSGIYDSFNPDPESFRAFANQALSIENSYLDPLFNEKIHLSPNTEVLGVRLADRYTIKQLKHIKQLLEWKEPRSLIENSLFRRELNANFNFASMSNSAETILHFIDTYDFLYKRSSTFRQLWRQAEMDGIFHYPAGDTHQWKFVTDTQTANGHLPTSRQHSTVNLLSKTIYILPDDIHYLGETGFIRVETERKLTHAMLNVLTRAHEPTVDIWTNRGALVHLSEKILKEAGFSIDTRLAYGLVTGEQIRTGQFRDGIDPRVYQTAAQRARDIEESYIKTRSFKTSRTSSITSTSGSSTGTDSLSPPSLENDI